MVSGHDRRQAVPARIFELIGIARRIADGCDWRSDEFQFLMKEFESRFTVLQGELPEVVDAKKSEGSPKGLQTDTFSDGVQRDDFESGPILVGAVEELDLEVRRCVEVLTLRLKAVEDELSGLRRSHKALQAYGLKG